MNRHAYLIMAYQKHNQLKTLIHALDDVRNDIFIHVDLKDDINLTEYENIAQHSKVVFIDRQNVSWGGHSQPDVELQLLKRALDYGSYRYFHLLSGMDMPIKTMDYIFSFFEKNDGKIFVECNDWHLHDKGLRFILRYDVYHLFQEKIGKKRNFLKYIDFMSCYMQHYLGISRTRHLNKVIKGGASWFSIPNDFAEYLISEEDSIRKFVKYGYCIDEVFLATWLFNSPFYDRVYKGGGIDGSTLRRYKWKDKNPTLVTIDDLKEYESEEDALFSRKFDIDTNKDTVDYLLDYLGIK